MQSYWHVSFLVLIALIWKVRPTHAIIDICSLETSNVSMYCTCHPIHRDDLEITCYVLGPLTPTNEVWPAFRDKENTVAFKVHPRLSTHLEFVPVRALQNLPSLETFTIQEANIETLLAGSISEMPNLKNLNLERNEIAHMERYAMYNLPKLKKLALSENSLTEILADTFSGLLELEELFLDRNNISTIEGCAFCSLHNLRELELWRNNIEDINERTFLGLRYVHRLDLFNNHLKTVPDNVFQSMPKLAELDLKNNMITDISPDAFNGLEHLGVLRLSNNQLKHLPNDVFKDVPKLMFVDLSLNKLEVIQGELIVNFPHATSNHFTFIFKNNPLKCSCEFAWLHYWLQKAGKSRFGQEMMQVECKSEDNKDMLIHEMKIKACAKKSSIVATETTIITSTKRHHHHHSAVESHGTKYEPEYADEVRNRTEWVHAATLQPLQSPSDHGSGVSNSHSLLILMIATLAIMALSPI